MFFLKSKARALKVRDRESGKMLDVGPRKWVPFGELPAGTTPVGDCDVEVRIAKTQEDLAAIEAENKLLADEDAKRAAKRAPAEHKAQEPADDAKEPEHKAKRQRGGKE